MARRELDRLVRRAAAGDATSARRALESGGSFLEPGDLVSIAKALLGASGTQRWLGERDASSVMAEAGVGLIERWSAIDRARGREPELWTWTLVSFDVWGNAENGWEVNGAHTTGDEIVLPDGASGKEAAEALAEAGLTRTVLEVDYEEEHTIAFCTKGGKPVGEIRRAGKANLP